MDCEPLGKIEMAGMFGVKEATVHQWSFRGQLPPPDHVSVNGSPAWDRSTLQIWGLRNGKNMSDADRDAAEAAAGVAS